jgi:hypothetical protein
VTKSNSNVFYAGLWLIVLACWIWVARHHHPTWLLNFCSSALLVGASALVATINAWALYPGLKASGQYWRYGLGLMVVLLMVDLAVVLVIGWIYDALWGPDPIRYTFWQNFVMDGAFIAIHLSAAVVLKANC